MICCCQEYNQNPDKRDGVFPKVICVKWMQSKSKTPSTSGGWWKFINAADCIHTALGPMTMNGLNRGPNFFNCHRRCGWCCRVYRHCCYCYCCRQPRNYVISNIWIEVISMQTWFCWRIASKLKPKPMPFYNDTDDNLLLEFFYAALLNALIHHFIL